MSTAQVRSVSDLQPYLSQIRAVLDSVLGGCQLYLFGSRATGRHHEGSDFDIAVLASRNIERELGAARELLEDSSIPFAVDLVDLSATSKDFALRIQQEGIPL